MATAISGGARIRTNTPAENAYMALQASSSAIAKSQLNLSTGKRINSAADDIAGYITVRALGARNGSLKKASAAAGEALNVTSITSDALDNINDLLQKIKDNAVTASSGALGTNEKVALAKASYALAQQIQTAVDSTVFGGKELLKGAYSGDWVIGYKYDNTALQIGLDMTTGNTSEFNVINAEEFNVNATSVANFAGVSGLNLSDLNTISESALGMFSTSNITTTLTSLATALNNISKVASYVGGIQLRLTSQDDLLKSQITNYNAAISRIENTDVAEEQLSLIKNQFLQQASLISLAQANQAPQSFLQIMQ